MPKKVLPAPGNESRTDFLNQKKRFFFFFKPQRGTLQALLRTGVMKEIPVQRMVFTVILPLGPFVSSGNEERAGVQVPRD